MSSRCAISRPRPVPGWVGAAPARRGVCLCIGDSRRYLLRDGVLTQITEDDTFVRTLGRCTAAVMIGTSDSIFPKSESPTSQCATNGLPLCYSRAMQVESIGIRELRQNASQIIEAAEGGVTYRVTNHGKDTGVRIGKGAASRLDAEPDRRPGATPEQVVSSGVYDSPKPERYEREMLRIVERGRTESGRVGE